VYPSNEVVSIDLTSFAYEDVCTVVKFVYTGELKLARESVGPIWQVADGLGITQIVRMCEDFLGHTTAQNAIYHYAVAERYQLKDLSKKIFAFIQERYAKMIMISSHKIKLMNIGYKQCQYVVYAIQSYTNLYPHSL